MHKWQIGKLLGSGSYSKVYSVKMRDSDESCLFAMKVVQIQRLSQKEQLNALNEVRILASINHPNIIGYKEAFIDHSQQTLNVVMEYANQGDLLHLLAKKKQDRIDEKQIWKCMIDCLVGLQALHSLRIIHRDLKAANIFMNVDSEDINGCVFKIGDLNVSKISQYGWVFTQIGTPYYAAPEVWRDEPYDDKSDIWSIGIVIYQMCQMKLPFQGKDMDRLYQKIQKGNYQPIQGYSQQLVDLISSMLTINPQNRPSAQQLLSHLTVQHKIEELGIQVHQFQRKDNELINTIQLNQNYQSIQLPQKKQSNMNLISSNPVIREEDEPIFIESPIIKQVKSGQKAKIFKRQNVLDQQIEDIIKIQEKEQMIFAQLEEKLSKQQNKKRSENQNRLKLRRKSSEVRQSPTLKVQQIRLETQPNNNDKIIKQKKKNLFIIKNNCKQVKRVQSAKQQLIQKVEFQKCKDLVIEAKNIEGQQLRESQSKIKTIIQRQKSVQSHRSIQSHTSTNENKKKKFVLQLNNRSLSARKRKTSNPQKVMEKLKIQVPKGKSIQMKQEY